MAPRSPDKVIDDTDSLSSDDSGIGCCRTGVDSDVQSLHPLAETLWQLEVTEKIEKPSVWLTLCTMLNYLVLILFGYLQELLRSIGVQRIRNARERPQQTHFVPLYASFDKFYNMNMYRRVRDCWNRPICSTPAAEMTICERITADYGWTFEFTGRNIPTINLGSYNYLGFAQNSGKCADDAIQAIEEDGIASCSTRHSFGNPLLQQQLESLVAEYLGVEDAMCFPMGFATNATNIATLIGKGGLILSDALNHASLILGCKLSGADIRVFNHNDMAHLESQLRNAIVYGQSRTRRPFTKILIIVEGVYSMEGSIVNLPEVIRLKKKYNAYLYLDEAHSIGAVGPSGRGVVDHFGCDPSDVDVLMGTFTKSFASAGGYIAGKRNLVSAMRVSSHSACYGGTMSPPVARQIISSMQVIMGRDGTHEGERRISQLHRNSRYFWRRLKQMGFTVYGDGSSPVVPLMLYLATGTTQFSRELLRRGIGVVVVGYPATPLLLARARFCLSAAHTKEQLDAALQAIDEVGQLTGTKYSSHKVTHLRHVQIQY